MNLAEGVRIWILKHKFWSTVLCCALAAGLAFLGYGIVRVVTAPALDCGTGMTVTGKPYSCVGLDLDGRPFSDSEPADLRALQNQVRAENTGSGPYVSLVLLLDFSPVAAVDTESDDHLTHAVEGAVTALWRADHTDDLGGALRIRLLLANMGSQYGSWPQAVRQITERVKSEHISGVIGLGQSTTASRRAAAALSDKAHLPVIGTTVTGDTMNIDPDTGRRITDFFRVTSTNTDAAIAAKQYLDQRSRAAGSVAIVADNATSDDYTETLVAAAKKELSGARVYNYTAPDSLPQGVRRDEYLSQQFKLMHDNLCQNPPSAVFFAGRGSDLGTFVNSWIQGSACGGPLTVISGDDASSAIDNKYVRQALKDNGMTVVYAATASPDEWGTGCGGSGPGAQPPATKVNYDHFWSDFTGRQDPCTKAAPISDDHTATLHFPPGDLSNADAMLTYDAAVAAITVARQDLDLVFSDPESQVAVLHQFTCQNMVAGSSGWIAFDADGNPVDKPVPLLSIHPDGTTSQVRLFWPMRTKLLSLPTSRQKNVPGC